MSRSVLYMQLDARQLPELKPDLRKANEVLFHMQVEHSSAP
jgi:hypothetical protein